MLDVYRFVTGLSYDDFDHKAKDIITGERFYALQEVCASIDGLGSKVRPEVLYFFLDEIITDEYKVTPTKLECFVDVLPNFCQDIKDIEAIQKQLWELGNLILDKALARRLVFRCQLMLGNEEIEATRVAACYILAKLKQQIEVDSYQSWRMSIEAHMRDPKGFNDTSHLWKDRAQHLTEALLHLRDNPEVDFDNVINLINEIKKSDIWTVSANKELLDTWGQILGANPNKDNAQIILSDFNEMLKCVAYRAQHFTFAKNTCLLALGLSLSIMGITNMTETFKLTTSLAKNITIICGISIAAGAANKNNVNVLSAICAKIYANGFMEAMGLLQRE